ncbi:DUF2141 domain-containing protein [Winogradskyella forsetii]|uniref:DUF2141 domain-containing protein n=1 Tax=Winogradskyella forsetii TaxID=2686077 RepID=UPI0015B989E7|nr:DUF2141 domain-containing protein [Winogradskyella forsetii]
MNLLVKTAIICLISFLSFQTQAQETFTMTVKVEEADNNDGHIFVALYDSESGFLSQPFKASKSTIKNKACTISFENIPAGTYAVSIFHDENDNGKLDTAMFGIPKEDYGCSNGATGFMGPPEWDDAKFELKENKSITISL